MRVANARMYSATPEAAAAWRTLLEWVIADAGVAQAVIDYPPPQPLPALWRREDLGCAFMCGFPLAADPQAHVVLAAPVPSPPAYAGLPRYWTCVVARGDGPVRSLADAFGRRMAFTTPDSQSGYQALRAWLAPQAHARGAPLFGAMVGPLVTPRRVVETVLAGEADAGPVDSYALELLRLHAPALIAPLVVIAKTPPTPLPPLVGAAGLPAEDASRLTRSLCAVGAAPELSAVRDALLLRGFATVLASDYAPLQDAAHHADALGYTALR
jgi:ABC-type phosphate/phosphonate transport system substrate-binding protein